MAEETKNNEEVKTVVQNAKGEDVALEDAKDTINKTYLKDNPLYKQIVYISNDQFDCVPVPFPELDYTVRPFVKEEPVGIKHPKYNWETFKWEEVGAEDTYQKMVKLQEKIDMLNEQAKKSAEANADLASMLALAPDDSLSEDVESKEGDK